MPSSPTQMCQTYDCKSISWHLLLLKDGCCTLLHPTTLYQLACVHVVGFNARHMNDKMSGSSYIY